jgi:hypothetical protein
MGFLLLHLFDFRTSEQTGNGGGLGERNLGEYEYPVS